MSYSKLITKILNWNLRISNLIRNLKCKLCLNKNVHEEKNNSNKF